MQNGSPSQSGARPRSRGGPGVGVERAVGSSKSKLVEQVSEAGLSAIISQHPLAVYCKPHRHKRERPAPHLAMLPWADPHHDLKFSQSSS